VDFALDPEQLALRETIVRFAQAELNAEARERDRDQTFPRALWKRCGEMGLTGLAIPEEHGGAGLSSLSTALALEAFGYGCRDGGLVFAVAAHLLAGAVPVWRHGTAEQKSRYLRGLATGELIAANAATEPGSGSDAFAMSTTAEAVDGGYRLRGTKTLCSNAPVADLLIVYAVTDRSPPVWTGISAFLVDGNAPGMSKSKAIESMGLRTCAMGEIALDDVFVTTDAVLGGIGGGATVFNHTMEWERALLAACHVGTMERLLEKAVAYARVRKVQGQPIGKLQAVSHRIADMKARLEAARLLAYRAAWRVGQGGGAGADAPLTKLFVSEVLLTTALDALRTLGGYGFLTEYEVERAVRDAVGSTLYSGTSDVQRNLVARWLGL
jgi:alkylation response protein AidB-like acyl-CoA dehydrogenase